MSNINYNEIPGRIEVPIYILEDDATALDNSSLGDSLPCKPAALNNSSPRGLADDSACLSLTLGGSTTTFSEPNSATSSLASLLLDPELQVSSRHSCSAPCVEASHLHRLQRQSNDGSLSARSDRSHDDIVEEITVFDHVKCKTLAPVKTHPLSTTSPPPMVPVYQNLNTNRCDKVDSRMPGLTIRPTRLHTNTFPHKSTYNPYDLGALLADFQRMKNRSPSAGAAPPPPSFNSSCSSTLIASVKRDSTVGLRKLPQHPPAPRVSLPARPPARQAVEPDSQKQEPDGIVMIPGVCRCSTTRTSAT